MFFFFKILTISRFFNEAYSFVYQAMPPTEQTFFNDAYSSVYQAMVLTEQTHVGKILIDPFEK